VAARNKLLEEMVQEATTRPLPGAPEEIKRIDLREAGERQAQGQAERETETRRVTVMMSLCLL
jgi:hypothetical protein